MRSRIRRAAPDVGRASLLEESGQCNARIVGLHDSPVVSKRAHGTLADRDAQLAEPAGNVALSNPIVISVDDGPRTSARSENPSVPKRTVSTSRAPRAERSSWK